MEMVYTGYHCVSLQWHHWTSSTKSYPVAQAVLGRRSDASRPQASVLRLYRIQSLTNWFVSR